MIPDGRIGSDGTVSPSLGVRCSTGLGVGTVAATDLETAATEEGRTSGVGAVSGLAFGFLTTFSPGTDAAAICCLIRPEIIPAGFFSIALRPSSIAMF